MLKLINIDSIPPTKRRYFLDGYTPEFHGFMIYSPLSRGSSPPNYSSNSAAPPSDAGRQSAALRGASLAFSSPLAPPKPPVNTYSGTDGALAAAAFAGVGRRRKEGEIGIGESPPRHLQKIERPPTVRRSTERGSNDNRLKEPWLQPIQDREHSPSHIAAALAASKSSPKHDTLASLRPITQRPLPLTRSRSDFSPRAEGPDNTPIAATDALVRLFEARQVSQQRTSETQIYHKQERSGYLASPTPVRPPKVGRTSPLASRSYDPTLVTGHTGEKPAKLTSSNPPPVSPRTSSRAAKTSESLVAGEPLSAPKSLKISSTLKATRVVSGTGPHVPIQERLPQPTARLQSQVPTPPPPRRSSRRPVLPESKDSGTSSYTNDSASNSSASSYASAVDQLRSPKSPIRRSKTQTFPPSPPPTRRFTAPKDNKPPSRPPSRPLSTVSTSLDRLPYTISTTKSSAEPILSLHSLTPQLTASSLANAMVASSLASSRVPSPSKPPPLPSPAPLVRHSKNPFFRHHNSQEQISRTPSPAKGMRHTMRGEKSFSDEGDGYKHHKGSRIIRKHPHKHHEGDRKRWRETITDKERKRYEGVWAANRGLFLTPLTNTSTIDITNPACPAPTGVLNLIVRDIWARSKLSSDDLAEIWDLVDGKGGGWLEKEEFVVGMWLVDQRLKGRKTPVVVGESVWGSVKGLSGVRVKHKR